jgi:Na+/H+ antiporter NhaD/arsenite permease-like protein
MLIFFCAGWPVPEVALLAGVLLLVTRRIKAEKVYREIDWSLLVLYIGLFIVIAGMEKTPAATDLFASASRYHLEQAAPMSIFAAVQSTLVRNVPAVLVFRGFIAQLPDSTRAWLTLAMANTREISPYSAPSPISSVIERARREDRISFWEYARAGVPLTPSPWLPESYRLVECSERRRSVSTRAIPAGIKIHVDGSGASSGSKNVRLADWNGSFAEVPHTKVM